jgi:protoporphyrin/coproporphyrin ferrochelatase
MEDEPVKLGVLLLNFGEPEHPTMEEVVPFLERIFHTNASLEGHSTPEERRARSRQLAEQRAPGLIAEYQEIGGSPLNEQARAQADALREELVRRGFDATTYVAYQFADPLVEAVVAEARDDGMQALVGLPVYPLCGPSTTVAALEQMTRAIAALGWDVPVHEIGGWHRHPDYVAMRIDAVRSTLDGTGSDLADPRTKLVFSAHGTPLKYLREGSRYDEYVKESCAAVARGVGADDYVVGYQNHGNRRIEWTQPDVDKVIEEIDADRVVVDAISFIHEQSETLAELDHELREEAEGRGLDFFRVPIPHDDVRFASVLADLIEPLVKGPRSGLPVLRECACRPGAWCTNG